MGLFRSIGRGIARIFGKGALSPPVAKAYAPPVAKPYKPPTAKPYTTKPGKPTKSEWEDQIPQAQALSHNEEVVASGVWIALASSWQDELRWNLRTKELDLKLIAGGWYRYSNVPIELVVEWIESASPGRFWWSNVRGAYSPATRIRKSPSRRGQGKVKANVVRIANPTRRK